MKFEGFMDTLNENSVAFIFSHLHHNIFSPYNGRTTLSSSKTFDLERKVPIMAKFGSIIGKLAAGALALGGLVLAGKTGFGKNLGEQTEDKDPMAIEPLGGDLDDDDMEETAPEEEGDEEEA